MLNCTQRITPIQSKLQPNIIYLSIYLSGHLSIYMNIYYMYLSAKNHAKPVKMIELYNLSIHISVYIPIYISSISPFIYLYEYLCISIYLQRITPNQSKLQPYIIYLSIYLSIYLYKYLSFSIYLQRIAQIQSK